MDLPGPLYPKPTRRSKHRYFFYDKHHKLGDSEEAQWLPDLSQDEEFAIFDSADWHEVSNDKGDLFGLRKKNGDVLDLGTRKEQVAKFPVTSPGQPWHGYPVGPLQKGRAGANPPVPLQVLAKMVDKGLLTAKQRRRLAGGKYA
jgi:hypothetical protein